MNKSVALPNAEMYATLSDSELINELSFVRHLVLSLRLAIEGLGIDDRDAVALGATAMRVTSELDAIEDEMTRRRRRSTPTFGHATTSRVREVAAWLAKVADSIENVDSVEGDGLAALVSELRSNAVDLSSLSINTESCERVHAAKNEVAA